MPMDSSSLCSHETLLERYVSLLHLFASQDSRTPEELARTLIQEIRPVLQFEMLDVVLFNSDRNEVQWRLAGAGSVLAGRVPLEETPSWWVYKHQQLLCIPDWNLEDRFPKVRETLAALHVSHRSFLGVPLTSAHRRLGSLHIAISQCHAYSDAQIHFLCAVADALAIAIDDAFSAEGSHRAPSDLPKRTRAQCLPPSPLAPANRQATSQAIPPALCEMSDEELLRFALALKYKCSTQAGLDFRHRQEFTLQLKEARAEWKKRFSRLSLSTTLD